VRRINIPVLLLAPAKDASFEPSRVLGAEFERLQMDFTGKIYPAVGPADVQELDLPRFGGRVVESIYSGVLMILLRLALGFSVPGFLSPVISNAVCCVSSRSFAVC
jgi:hypothetical protein